MCWNVALVDFSRTNKNIFYSPAGLVLSWLHQWKLKVIDCTSSYQELSVKLISNCLINKTWMILFTVACCYHVTNVTNQQSVQRTTPPGLHSWPPAHGRGHWGWGLCTDQGNNVQRTLTHSVDFGCKHLVKEKKTQSLGLIIIITMMFEYGDDFILEEDKL